MSHLISLNIELSKLKELDQKKIYTAKSGKKSLEILIGINDETNQYGQSVAAWVGQSKEERESKERKVYIGNGKVLKTDGRVHLTERTDQKQEEEDNDMPF